jgi:hypothetical protein
LNPAEQKQLYFVLDDGGSFIVFEEKNAAWAGLLAFSSEELAREFCRIGGVDVAELVAIDPADSSSVAALIANVKKRAVRYLLLDLDYRTGQCTQVEFAGYSFGPATPRQFRPRGASGVEESQNRAIEKT